MIEVCPRCSCRLGSPLKSGRLVCANCGWSNDPPPSKRGVTETKRSPVVELLTVCSRIIRRTFVYVVQVIQTKIQDFRSARADAPPTGKRLVEGLSDRLNALEKAIPIASDEPRWLSIEEAFRYLGGDPSDSNSVVTTENGSTTIPFRRFRSLTSVTDFKAFGLDADLARRDAQKPWLRWTIEK
ncbi:MAG: hypothetical protein MH252_09450 [Thermosynechococcaceae cyanobacterium MS004]|nr:hypothetical protein [Thermosynechococcaceae cyanobacterium MS004]